MRSLLGRLLLLTSALCGLVALISIPAFDPGHFRGAWFGMVNMGLWSWALFAWAIGLFRKNGSRLRATTALLLIAALALMFGACPWLHAQLSMRLGFAVISAAMVHEAWHDWGQPDRPSTTPRGRFSRIVLSSAGLLGLAVVIRDWLDLV
jgi:hypothetical protein